MIFPIWSRNQHQSAEWRHPAEPNPNKSFWEDKNQNNINLFLRFRGNSVWGVCFTMINGYFMFYLSVLQRLLSRIHRVRPQYRENGSWCLLYDNAPFHRSTLVTDFFCSKTTFLLSTIHASYSLDLVRCNFYLLSKLHLSWKGKSFDDIKAIQRASILSFKNISKYDLKHSFDELIDRAKCCIEAKGNYFP